MSKEPSYDELRAALVEFAASLLYTDSQDLRDAAHRLYEIVSDESYEGQREDVLRSRALASRHA